MVRIGLCLPIACSESDMDQLMLEYVAPFLTRYSLSLSLSLACASLSGLLKTVYSECRFLPVPITNETLSITCPKWAKLDTGAIIMIVMIALVLRCIARFCLHIVATAHSPISHSCDDA
jgi:hypothetical protein